MKIDGRALLIAASVLAITACSGSGGQSYPVGVAATHAPAPDHAAVVTFSIVIPPAAVVVGRRRASASGAGRSIVVTLDAANGRSVSLTPSVISVAADATNCVASSAGRTCTGRVAAIVGDDTFRIDEHASSDGSGPVLATTVVSLNVAASGSTLAIGNSASVSLDGVVSTIEITAASKQFTFGVAGSTALTVRAVDATGQPILLPGATLQLSVNGGANAFKVSSLAGGPPLGPVGVPPIDEGTGFGTPIAVHYNGTQNVVARYGITATVRSAGNTYVGTSSVVIAGVPSPPAPSTLPPRLFVLDTPPDGDATLRVFPLDATGNSTPLRVIDLGVRGAKAVGGNAVVVTPAGEALVELNLPNGPTEILRVAPNATGTTPDPLVGDPNTALDPVSSLAIDADRNIFTSGVDAVYNQPPFNSQIFEDDVLEFQPRAHGTTQPVRAFDANSYYDFSAFSNCLDLFSQYPYPLYQSTATAAVVDPRGIYLFSTNLIFRPSVASGCSTGAQIIAADPSQAGDPVPAIALVGNPALTSDNAGVAYFLPTYLALAADPTSTVYALSNTGQIDVYSPITAAQNGALPIRSLAGSDLQSATGITVANGTIYVANPSTKKVLIYSSTASGTSVLPTATLSGVAAGLSSPVSLAIGPS